MLQPSIIPINDKEYELEKEYAYEFVLNNATFRISVPKGFIYDGASVPRILWTLTGILPDGLIRAGALLHDYIYHHQGILPAWRLMIHTENGWQKSTLELTRPIADNIFLEAMIKAGVRSTKAHVAWAGVRVGGWVAWYSEKRPCKCPDPVT